MTLHPILYRTAFCLGLFCGGLAMSYQAGTALAATTDPAYAAFDQGKYILAIKEAKKAASRGEPQAYTLLGRIYSEGLGVPRNLQEAARWYQQGAGKGDVDSQFALALMLAQGKGLARNDALAADLFQQAADKGHVEAQYNMALIYSDGLGRTQDHSQAAKYLKLAAQNGNVKAQYDLGTFYALGQGVRKNSQLAQQWTKKAADSGLSNAQVEYAIMLIKGITLTEQQKNQLRANPALRRSIDIEAAKYFKMAADKGNPVAQNRLARLYYFGFGVRKNIMEAAKWHFIARAKGVSDGKLDFLLQSALTPKQREQVDLVVQNWQDNSLLK